MRTVALTSGKEDKNYLSSSNSDVVVLPGNDEAGTMLLDRVTVLGPDASLDSHAD